jgi:hypothetical protein
MGGRFLEAAFESNLLSQSAIVASFRNLSACQQRTPHWSQHVTVKDKIETVSSIVTTLAVIIGGYWTYALAIRGRDFEPHANIAHYVSNISLPNNVNLLRLKVRIANTGKSVLTSIDSNIEITRILPLLPCDSEPVELPRSGNKKQGSRCKLIDELELQATRTNVISKYINFSWPIVANYCTVSKTPSGHEERPSGYSAKNQEPECQLIAKEDAYIIEPSEHMEINYEFALPTDLKIARITTFYKNENQKTAGWILVSYYDFRTHRLI